MKTEKNRPTAAFLILFLTGLFCVPLTAQNVTITQLDTSKLFVSSRLDCYVSLTDSTGNPLSLDASGSGLSVYHTAQGETVPLDVLEVERNDQGDEGITFLMVLDNSGSMYETGSEQNVETRSIQALKAARTFYSSLDVSRDRAGLAVFNRDYRLLSPLTGDFRRLEEALSGVEAPSREEAYTELYYTIIRAAKEMSGIRGRKAIILLSDGENFPYFQTTGTPHPDLGKDSFLPSQAREALAREEVTLYAVNFAPEKDLPLAETAVASGGRVFDAADAAELEGVYDTIRRNINMEYRLKVKVPVTLAGKALLEVRYANGSPAGAEPAVVFKESRDSRVYSTGLIFGSGRTDSVYFAILIAAAGLLLWLVLFFLRLEKPAGQAELTKLPGGAGRALVKTMILSSPNTVIGGSGGSDYTITGIPAISESRANIIRDDKGTFTLVSSKEVLVNNRPVKKRKLTPGDVINVEGATLVFDAPEETGGGK